MDGLKALLSIKRPRIPWFTILKLLSCMLLIVSGVWSQNSLINLSTVTRFVDTSPANAYDAFAVMMKASNGTILNFYRKGTSHAGDRGVVMLRSSANGGVSWTPHDNGSGGVDQTHGCTGTDPLGCIFADATLDSRNAFGGLSNDGSTLIAGWNTYNFTGSPVGGCASASSCQAYFSRSTDNGATWTNGTAFVGYDAGYGSLLVVPSTAGASGSCSTGCTVASLRATGGTSTDLVFTYNNGSSWPTARSHPQDLTSYEMGITSLGGDKLLAFMRDTSSSCSDNCALAAYYSLDMGVSWTNLCGTPSRPACGGSSNDPSPGTDPLSCLAPLPGTSYVTGAGGGCEQVSPLLLDAGLGTGQITLFYTERDSLTGTQAPCPNGPSCGMYIMAVTFNGNNFINSPASLGALQVINQIGVKATGGVSYGYPAVAQINSTRLLVQWYSNTIDQGGVINLYSLTADYRIRSAGAPMFAQVQH